MLSAKTFYGLLFFVYPWLHQQQALQKARHQQEHLHLLVFRHLLRCLDRQGHYCRKVLG